MEKTWYDTEEDILNIGVKRGTYWKSVELQNGIIIDIAKDGAILAIEILKASKVVSGDVKKVIENARVIAA